MKALKATKTNPKSGAVNRHNGLLPVVLIPMLALSLISIHTFLSTRATNTISKPSPDATAPSTEVDPATRQRINAAFGKLPLYFIENQGQMDERVAYYLEGKDKSVWFTSEG